MSRKETEKEHRKATNQLVEEKATEAPETESDTGESLQESAESVVEEKTPEDLARDAAAEWKEKYLRQLAEFDNFRKRTRQDIESAGRHVRESLLVSLLPIKDDFDRMLESEKKSDDAFHKGVELIHNKLNALLDSLGVKPMEGRGTLFDPARHDALMIRPTADFPPGTVLDVITPGYLMGDRVIRHAQVVVSSEAEAETTDHDQSSADA